MSYDAVKSAQEKSRARINSAEIAFREKASSAFSMDGGDGMGGSLFNTTGRGNAERYSLFRGWVYAAINALASEGASQPVNLAKLEGATNENQERRTLPRKKQADIQRIFTKSAEQEWELILQHPMLDCLEYPNPSQGKWQFVYSFIANLCLTGFGYVIGGVNDEGKMELYSLPTTWVTPIHTPKPFSAFRVCDPAKASSGGIVLPPENVKFANLPNPANPLGSLSPTGAQSNAVRIDDKIQTSQEMFFDNGIFPSVVVTVGKDPHPDHSPAGGVRPRLTPEQRRQVTSAIRKVMSGVSNYGNPAIVDGLIERIERLSATSNEMGWDKSEDKVRTRILSAFGVHPYILGEPVNVGGYAQAAKIEERFCRRVNTYLDMLSSVVTGFAQQHFTADKLFAWWEPCESSDPALRWAKLSTARKNNDITRNELRVELGFPPDEMEQAGQSRSLLLDSPNGVTSYIAIASAVAAGSLTEEAAKFALMTFFQIDEATAGAMLQGGVLSAPTSPALVPPQEPEEADDELEIEMEDAVASLHAAVKLLQASPNTTARLIEAAAKE